MAGDRISLDAQLANMNADVLGCRDLGHNWERGVTMNATLLKGKKVIEAERVLKCMGMCGCVRTDVFRRDAYGDLVKVKNVISYPDDYTFQREDPEVPVGRATRMLARQTLMSRLAPGLAW